MHRRFVKWEHINSGGIVSLDIFSLLGTFHVLHTFLASMLLPSLVLHILALTAFSGPQGNPCVVSAYAIPSKVPFAGIVGSSGSK